MQFYFMILVDSKSKLLYHCSLYNLLIVNTRLYFSYFKKLQSRYQNTKYLNVSIQKLGRLKVTHILVINIKNVQVNCFLQNFSRLLQW